MYMFFSKHRNPQNTDIAKIKEILTPAFKPETAADRQTAKILAKTLKLLTKATAKSVTDPKKITKITLELKLFKNTLHTRLQVQQKALENVQMKAEVEALKSRHKKRDTRKINEVIIQLNTAAKNLSLKTGPIPLESSNTNEAEAFKYCPALTAACKDSQLAAVAQLYPANCIFKALEIFKNSTDPKITTNPLHQNIAKPTAKGLLNALEEIATLRGSASTALEKLASNESARI